MPLRDLLRKKDNKKQDTITPPPPPPPKQTPSPPPPPQEFTFLRSDTHTEELIHPPTFPPSPSSSPSPPLAQPKPKPNHSNHRPFRLRKSSNASTASSISTSNPKNERRLSERLHLRGSHSRSTSQSSIHVPSDLPTIDGAGDKDHQEAQWERRATLLATSGVEEGIEGLRVVERDDGVGAGSREKGRKRGTSVSDPKTDENIQEAIRLHESGDLERSTAMFGRLADPSGANNALSQVLYGLALRHGWGCSPDPPQALHYLSLAAQNSAAIESMALQESGMKKGGAAKGELVLAIYELANCFRHGWGVPKKDPVAAKQYYETAANLGDVDAMNETAWCYLNGFGTRKDKVQAAKYYRLAEQNGSKTLGNSWIWKEKYNT